MLDRVISKSMIDAAVELDTYYMDLEPDTLNKDYLLENLNELIETAQAKGTDVQLVVNPYYPPFARKITNLAWFKARIEKYTGLKVNDYSEAISDEKASVIISTSINTELSFIWNNCKLTVYYPPDNG